MTATIQNCKTLLYLRPNGEWTQDQRSAAHFPSSAAALRHILHAQIPDAQIILHVSGPEYDVVLPISEDCRGKAA